VVSGHPVAVRDIACLEIFGTILDARPGVNVKTE